MKNLIIFVGIIFSSLLSILAGDFEYPKIIDGGEVNIRYYSNKALAFNTNNYRTIQTFIKNVINENLYLYGTKKISTYDSVISANGNQNFCMFDDNYSILKPGDSIEIGFQFFTKFIDSISLSGNKLQSIWRIYYRRESSLKLDSIDILTQYSSVDKDEVIFDQWSSRVLSNVKKGYKSDSDIDYNYSFCYNLTNKKIIIDSINYKILGVNFKKLVILNNDSALKNDTSISFPYILDENNHLTFKVPFQSIKPEVSKCYLTVFYHFIDSTSALSKTDTILTKFKLMDYMSFQISTVRYLTTKIDDTLKITSNQGFSVYNTEDKFWKFVKISSQTKLDNVVNLELFEPLPVLIKTYQMKKLVKISFIGKQIGFDTIKVTLDFEDSLGNKMQRSNVYYINVLKSTDVIPDLSIVESHFSISPNPATDFIEISVGTRRAVSEQTDVRIYNIFGQSINLTPTLSNLGEGVRLDVSGLSPGMYFVRIGTSVQKFIKL